MQKKQTKVCGFFVPDCLNALARTAKQSEKQSVKKWTVLQLESWLLKFRYAALWYQKRNTIPPPPVVKLMITVMVVVFFFLQTVVVKKPLGRSVSWWEPELWVLKMDFILYVLSAWFLSIENVLCIVRGVC